MRVRGARAQSWPRSRWPRAVRLKHPDSVWGSLQPADAAAELGEPDTSASALAALLRGSDDLDRDVRRLAAQEVTWLLAYPVVETAPDERRGELAGGSAWCTLRPARTQRPLLPVVPSGPG